MYYQLYTAESTELLKPARGSSFLCRAFKTWLSSKSNNKSELGSGLALAWLGKKDRIGARLGLGLKLKFLAQ